MLNIEQSSRKYILEILENSAKCSTHIKHEDWRNVARMFSCATGCNVDQILDVFEIVCGGDPKGVSRSQFPAIVDEIYKLGAPS